MANQAGQDSPATPQLCEAGCGFYANIGTGGMCSKCHREQQAASRSSAAVGHELAEAMRASTPTPALPPQQQQQQQQQQPQELQQQQQQQPPQELAPPPASTAAAAAASSAQAAQPPAPASPAALPPARPPPSATRCLVCNKKVGLTGFSCKCDDAAVFCSTHRYAEAHACTFDYKNAQRALLAQRNPVVEAAKVDKL